MKMKILLKAWPVAFLLINACNTSETTAKNIPDPLAMHIDSTIDPSQDFFHFANGKWFKQNPIPASERSNGIFRTIQDTINDQVKSICEESSQANAPGGSNKQKIGDFFA